MPTTSSRAEALFMDVLALPVAERSAFLERACGTEPQLHSRVQALVAAHESATSLLEPPAAAQALVPAEEKPGDSIARYKLLEKLGEGGCGAVWAAEQREPVKRRVALKIIKLGMDTRQVIARFEAERQALAMMDHPNIAKMLDAGATAAGRPYFVMELVRGIPITTYCDENNLTTAQRLELLIKVCHAIQHAHQKGIIHRDIKPSNVLVTLHDGEPVPKVIDFGIAKATQQELTEKTIYTKFQQFIGTPAYMSPEQAEMSGLDIDTRSDIYSLGVLLYELVTGRTPFDSKELLQQGVDEIRRTIREKEPARPSARIQTMQHEELTTAARRRSTDPRKLAAAIRGDLDWVVMKCLEKDRTRRYDTANGVAMDVQRFLGHEPVVARPPSAAYRTKKFVRRHRVAFSAAATVLAVVVAGSILTTAQALRALRAERAQNELQKAARVATANEAAARRTAEEEQRRSAKVRWARETALPEITRLRKKSDIAGAFALARHAEEFIPNDPELTALWPKISAFTTIETTPEGADVYMKPYRTPDAAWEFVGKSPVKDVRVARELHRWQFKKEGYQLLEIAAEPQETVRASLDRTGTLPPGMVRVAGGRSPGFMLAVGQRADLSDFLIDRFEVTNRQFKEFVDAGGYAQQKYWKNRFIQDGRELPWSEAMDKFRDTTGRPGPATWSNGSFAQGEADLPVSGINWFEAAACAEWMGKRLPSVYHWNRAAGSALAADIVPLSNFGNRGPVSVGRYQGMSWCGAFDMAGNVKEWCWNETGNGKRYLVGGGAGEPEYMFSQADAVNPFDRSRLNGFRCIKLLSDAALQEVVDAEAAPRFRDFAKQQPVKDDVFATYRSLFAYDRTALEARIDESDDRDERWRVERISFNAAYNNERMLAVLFLPKKTPPPYQTVVYFPGSGSPFNSTSSEKLADEGAVVGASAGLAAYVQSGRAVVWPIYKGTFERHFVGQEQGIHVPKPTAAYRDRALEWSKDFQRTLDYLETRQDVRTDKIAYVGFSWGAVMGQILLSIDSRPKVGILVSGGLGWEALPEADTLNHAPRVKIPILMLNGRYDFTFPVDSSQRPLFQLLGTPPEHKRHLLYDSLHPVPVEKYARDAVDWLDRYLGPVK